MAPYKWSFIVLLFGLFLLGLPNEVRPSEETKPSSVKECRVHIEKALEQYWDQKEPFKSEKPLDQTITTINSLNTDDKDDDDILENKNKNDDDDEEDDDEDKEDENCVRATQEDKNENENKEDDYDAENEDEDDEHGNDDGKIKTTFENENLDDNDEDGADDNGNDEDEDEEDENTNQINLESSHNKLLSELGKGSEHTNMNKEIGSTEPDKNENDDDDDDDDDEEDDDDDEEDDNDDSIEDEKDEQKEKDEETNAEVDVKESGKKDEHEKIAESHKVTGGAYSATAGVVSELPVEKPSIKQPQTKTVQEETVNITMVTKEETTTNQSKDDDAEFESKGDEGEETIENIYEDDEDEPSSILTFRSRDHVDVILGLDEIGTEFEKEEEKLAQNIFKEIKKIQLTSIKPMEMLYKYTDSTTRVLGDAEIFTKPMLLFLGPWNSGKTTIINYLLGIERTPAALKTGTGITDVDFTVVTYGEQKQMISGTELAVDWRYAGVQKFGQGFLDHFRSISIPSTLLKKVTIVDTPGILENRKNTERGYPFNDAFQWFIDRADTVYVVLDPTKVDIGGELGSVLDQLKGRDVRFILNKADTIRRSDLMRVVGQLFWNLSPLMSSSEAPLIYAVSLTSKPFHPSAPARFLADQEKNFLSDMKETLEKRVENRILYARKHAVRVRNHAQMVDCYLATYYRHKSIFSNKKNVAKAITENPKHYNIFEGLSSMSNVSRYDIPDPNTYKEFFKLHPLYDFKPLPSTCSYFRGCPMDKLDAAIGQEIPELFAKYKKAKATSSSVKQEGR